ncbi:hypothetical protein NMK71_08340 [Weeksellaceae bacterium KMM 9713]|uniref:Uncharacterized protein n=1 Tax=Profundicola chukchiensis TaxID=2961959 RepID=A0A9X4MZD3_9FLAO|nr:hypothetical protein [Profundicola chukchiensis]MDG4946420.1 hypothetical protein [Profundicola chukchiensis]
MIASFISLAGILMGILGSNFTGLAVKKYSLGLTGNTILGVFGSILFIKSFGRLGFSPNMIMESGHVDYILLLINFIVSFIGGGLFLILISLIKNKIEARKK